MSDLLQLAKVVEALRAEMRLRSAFEAEPQTKWSSVGFQDVLINLADTKFSNGGNVEFPIGGYELTFLRRGSVPGAILQIVGGGQLTQPFAPGDQVRGAWGPGELQLQLFPGSVATGYITLRVAKNPQLHFRESPIEVPVTPLALLGTFVDGSPGFATAYATNLEPTGAQAGQFNATGWKRAAVFVDTLDTVTVANATSFQLLPYFRSRGDASRWFAQPDQLLSEPDTNPTAFRYRILMLNLARMQGFVYLGSRNLLGAGGAANTLLSLCVVGLE